MKTLLIVEDEKMIRQGIAAMARRCSVSIENILECRNGVEALEILNSQQVDVMFTDIRMPKMDGIELVKRTAELAHCPQIVVVSGFDDFNYAVEMMKNGVRDYLLKPIKRDKVEEILSRMDKELEQEQKEAAEDVMLLQKQFRYLLLNENISDSDWEHAGRKIAGVFTGTDVFEDGYVIGVGAFLGEMKNVFPGKRVFGTNDVDGKTVFFLSAGELDAWKAQMPEGLHPGLSKVHQSFSEIKKAYLEADEARKKAFVTGKTLVLWSDEEEKTAESESAGNIFGEELEQQFVNQFATERLKEAVRKLDNLYFEVSHHPEKCGELVTMTEKIRQGLDEKYGKLLEGEGENTASCQPALYYGTGKQFLENFHEWVFQMKAELQERFDTDQNREKIQKAVEYIQENYQKDLNMALVSNYVSMNYSLFSVTFKEYTGVNFVNYLKDIRIRQAKQLLTQTEEKIVDISRMVGYENEKHFMKIFKSVCGVSPSEYRKGELH